MTIDEAIEILEFHLVAVGDVAGSDYPNAIKLGKEALKWVKKYRPRNKTDKWSLLPGETRE